MGLPPLNGFVSEWVTFQALLAGGLLEGPLRLQVLAVAGLALIGALALACFARVCGVVFLGQPRMPDAWSATETERGMLVPLYLLVLACAFIGLMPAVAIGPSVRIGAAVGPEGVGMGAMPRHLVAAAETAGWVSAGLLLLATLLGLARSRMRKRRRPPAADLALRLRPWRAADAIHRFLVRGAADRGVPADRGRASGAERIGLPVPPDGPVLDGRLRPLWHGLRWTAEWLRPIQQGRLPLYLIYVVATVILLLLLSCRGAAA